MLRSLHAQSFSASVTRNLASERLHKKAARILPHSVHSGASHRRHARGHNAISNSTHFVVSASNFAYGPSQSSSQALTQHSRLQPFSLSQPASPHSRAVCTAVWQAEQDGLHSNGRGLSPSVDRPSNTVTYCRTFPFLILNKPLHSIYPVQFWSGCPNHLLFN